MDKDIERCASGLDDYVASNDVQENRGKHLFSCTGETYPNWFHVNINNVNAVGINDGKGSVFSIATDEKEVFIDIINSDIRPIGSYAALEARVAELEKENEKYRSAFRTIQERRGKKFGGAPADFVVFDEYGKAVCVLPEGNIHHPGQNK